jgi:pimeloyl-ACP methyl ester carboxylesterase
VTPLVLLHAFPLESGMYAGVGHHLSGGVVTLDLPGFGGTPVPTGEPSMDVYADAVAFELDRLGHERVILGGTSMGGYAAMAFCRRHRDRVAGLALIDTKAAADVPDAAAGRRAMAERMLDSDSTDALVESVLPKLLGETTHSGRWRLVLSHSTPSAPRRSRPSWSSVKRTCSRRCPTRRPWSLRCRMPASW